MMYVFKEGEIATAYKKLMTWLKETVFPQIRLGYKTFVAFIRRHWKPLVISGAILIAVALFVNLITNTLPWVEQEQEGPRWTPWGEVISKIVTPFLAFIITLLGLYRIFKQFQIQVNQVKDQAENSRKQIAAEQFKNAIDHLGDEKHAIVLGGVHALHNLARNYPKEYSQQVFEVLCSFVREETTKPEYQRKVLEAIDSYDKKQAALQASSLPTQTNQTVQGASLIVIQTIVDKLFRDEKSREFYQMYDINLSGAFLRGVNFYYAHLQKKAGLSDLEKADLQGVVLACANLQGAWLHCTNLRGANLGGANLQKAWLSCANLQGAKLMGETNLQEAFLKQTKLQGARLLGTDLRETDLEDAKFQGASFRHVRLQKNVLLGTDFRGIHSSDEEILLILDNAIKSGTGLKTDLSGITLYDDEGNKLILTEEQKKEWLHKRGAKVDDLSTDETQEFFKELKTIWNIEEIEEESKPNNA